MLLQAFEKNMYLDEKDYLKEILDSLQQNIANRDWRMAENYFFRLSLLLNARLRTVLGTD